MATTTTNLALIKPAGTDKIRISQINSNMDVLDAKIGPVGNTSLQAQLNNKQGALTFDSVPTSGSTNPVTSGGIYTEAGNLAEAMAILSNNNTHVAISSGQYVYVRGHGTLTEGLYKATAAIAANGTLSTSNLQAVPNGGLNALKSSVDTLNSNFTIQTGTVNVLHSSMTLDGTWRKYGKIVLVCFNIFKVSADIVSDGEVVNLFNGLPAPGVANQWIEIGHNGRCGIKTIGQTGGAYAWWSTIKAGSRNGFNFMYISN